MPGPVQSMEIESLVHRLVIEEQIMGIPIPERGSSVDENQIHNAIEQAYQLIVEAHRNMTGIWRNQVLFTRQWWLGVGLSICPWLLEAGIHVFQYNKGVLHAKVMIIDGEIAEVGSSNYDLRSYRMN